jgi:hypothetical protein
MMPKFRKKPVVIEAMQYTDTMLNYIQLAVFMGQEVIANNSKLEIKTLEGVMTASKGDWIIKGVHGEFYPCKPDIFELTYEEEDE